MWFPKKYFILTFYRRQHGIRVGFTLTLTFLYCSSCPSRRHVFQRASVRCLHKGRTKQPRRRRGRSDQPWRGVFRLLSKRRWRDQRRRREALFPTAVHARPALSLQRWRGWRSRGGLRRKRSWPLQVRPEHAAQEAVSGLRGRGFRLSLWCGVLWGLQSFLQENNPRWGQDVFLTNMSNDKCFY